MRRKIILLALLVILTFVGGLIYAKKAENSVVDEGFLNSLQKIEGLNIYKGRGPEYSDINSWLKGYDVFAVIVYDESGQVKSIDLIDEEIFNFVKTLEGELQLTIMEDKVPLSVWIAPNYGHITIIPPNLRNSIFTRMFFFEGAGLEHFKQVFRNDQVKIYEVV